MFASWIQKYRAGKAQKAQAGRLYQAALQATIDPQLYQTYQLADRFETRFDVLALHLFLMLEALEKSGPGDAANLQRLVLEAAMRDLEDTMRRRGISDVRIGKTVQKHSTIFFGRLASCRKVREGSEPLTALLVRTVYRGQQDHSAKAFACYLDDLAGRFLDLQTGWWQDPAFRWPKAASQSG